jgi:hydrogenase large subunit
VGTPNVTIDPVTRIEGHLRVECEVQNGVITDAWVSCSLFRGMELVMKGRAPSDAFYVAQRICGVCPISHGHASTMATESALGITIPNGARLVRNIIEGAQYLHSHILWFYTLAALDYIDPSKALEADVANTYALAQQAGTTTSDFGAVKTKLANLMASGQVSIFTNGWFKHPAYAQNMPAELALIGVAHYLEALEMQAEASRIIAIMGGKFPHFMTSLPGGTAWVPTEEKLGDVLFRLQRVADFVNNTMVPDTLAIAPFYTDALKYGGGHGNFLAWGVFNNKSLLAKDRYLPEGIIKAGSLTPLEADGAKVKEYVKHAWFATEDGARNPSEGQTNPAFTSYDVNNKYTWAKAPRYDGLPMEAGPLSRMLVAYVKGVEPVVKVVDLALGKLGASGHPEVLVSLLGRVASKVLESAVVAQWSLEWVNELVAAIKGGDVKLFEESEKKDGEGAGLWEAPRGAVGHWINVKGGRIENYQVCTPSTWNMGGRDDNDTPGVLEKALIGAPCLDPTKPMEAARIARSFDP